MTVKDAMSELEALGNEKVREMNARNGVGTSQFGAKMGDIRAIAKKIKIDHELALELWKTGNLDARLLATLILKPSALSQEELDSMVRAVPHPPYMAPSQLADWLYSYVTKVHPDREALRQKWMSDSDPMASRAGWSLTADRVANDSEGLDLTGLLDRIEREMASAPAPTEWTMNACLAQIGIYHPKLRKRALEIGEKLSVFRDYPCSKGCTSPFAPIWINEMVKRQG